MVGWLGVFAVNAGANLVLATCATILRDDFTNAHISSEWHQIVQQLISFRPGHLSDNLTIEIQISLGRDIDVYRQSCTASEYLVVPRLGFAQINNVLMRSAERKIG